MRRKKPNSERPKLCAWNGGTRGGDGGVIIIIIVAVVVIFRVTTAAVGRNMFNVNL